MNVKTPSESHGWIRGYQGAITCVSSSTELSKFDVITCTLTLIDVRVIVNGILANENYTYFSILWVKPSLH